AGQRLIAPPTGTHARDGYSFASPRTSCCATGSVELLTPPENDQQPHRCRAGRHLGTYPPVAIVRTNLLREKPSAIRDPIGSLGTSSFWSRVLRRSLPHGDP